MTKQTLALMAFMIICASQTTYILTQRHASRACPVAVLTQGDIIDMECENGAIGE